MGGRKIEIFNKSSTKHKFQRKKSRLSYNYCYKKGKKGYKPSTFDSDNAMSLGALNLSHNFMLILD
jgi:hypothetical protein